MNIDVDGVSFSEKINTALKGDVTTKLITTDTPIQM
jgi:hypothetical protein